MKASSIPPVSSLKLKPDIERALKSLQSAARAQRRLKAEDKNALLTRLALRLEQEAPAILTANHEDLRKLEANKSAAFRDRLTLSPQRIAAMAESLRQVAKLPDPVNELIEEIQLPNGLRLRKLRAPLGVILMIFESRPNVIFEAFSLAFKSGNAIVLRGGSEAAATSAALYKVCAQLLPSDLSPLYGIQDYDRSIVEALLKRKDIIDVVVPRGGDQLIDFVQRNALMPIIKNDRGLCHTYVHEDADLEMAVKIVANAKTQRPGVCNSLETVLVHRACAAKFIPHLYSVTEALGLKWKADEASRSLLAGKPRVEPAAAADWDTEYLDLIMNCRVVDSLDEAINHIERHGSRHSEAILTRDESTARYFQSEVDAAAVYWNASTRFTDGFEFGLGGELGISTQKLHVRGPVGLRELTSPRWVIDGNGQVRG